MAKHKKEALKEKEYVFGLDIGTRNVVGTVGYKEDEKFIVVSQVTKEHKSRSMIDGQIHDIEKVSNVIVEVKKELEEHLGFELKSVCIAAAGRVLQTVTTRVSYEYEEESIVTGEDIYTLDLLGVDKAYSELTEGNHDYKFYYVGYTIMKHFLNGEEFKSLEGHKATKIEEDIIVTFLPEDVVDGLYTAVERAGLNVANMTLEPIAAINVAIPENYRMLNISLVDVGAGTSDICITDDGSIIAYGMIPMAGDELTEVIVKKYLVDFANAEKIKKGSLDSDEVTYEDIMGITHKVSSKEVWETCSEVMDQITTAISEKIIELNGDKPVAAVFVVGGGGKVHGFCESIAKKIGIIDERVALRGEDVMKFVEFEQKEIKKDSLLVTPIGICLNFYEQRNSFIMIRFNGERMKLYDNGFLKVIDAALQAGITTDELFPKRGAEISFTVDGVKRMERGHAGESAKVYMNGREVGLNDTLLPNCEITIEKSTAGDSAVLHIGDLDEFNNSGYVDFVVNNVKVRAPKFVEVNGNLATADYAVKNGDVIETKPFYTVGQLADFMDVVLHEDHEILVNNKTAGLDTIIYENFSVEWTVDELAGPKSKSDDPDTKKNMSGLSDYAREQIEYAQSRREAEKDRQAGLKAEILKRTVEEGEEDDEDEAVIHDITVTVNDTEITMVGKTEYIFVDIYNYYELDTEKTRGMRIVTKINGELCSFADVLHDGDKIEVYWIERKDDPLL